MAASDRRRTSVTGMRLVLGLLAAAVAAWMLMAWWDRPRDEDGTGALDRVREALPSPANVAALTDAERVPVDGSDAHAADEVVDPGARAGLPAEAEPTSEVLGAYIVSGRVVERPMSTPIDDAVASVVAFDADSMDEWDLVDCLAMNVHSWRWQHSAMQHVEADAQGNYRLELPLDGSRVRLVAFTERHLPSISNELPPAAAGLELRYNFALELGASVHVVARGFEGEPGEYRVGLHRTDGEMVQLSRVELGEGFTCRFEGLADSTYSVSLRRESLLEDGRDLSLQLASEEVRTFPGIESEVELVAGAQPSLMGRFLAPADFEGVRLVGFFPGGEAARMTAAVVEESGAFAVPDWPGEAGLLAAVGEERDRARVLLPPPVEIDAGPAPTDVVLDAFEPSLRLTVLESGAPVGGVVPELFAPEDAGRTRTFAAMLWNEASVETPTDADGRLEVCGLESGWWTFRVERGDLPSAQLDFLVQPGLTAELVMDLAP